MWLLCAVGIACAADLPPEVLLLQKARVAMARNLTRLPNYTCLQTIERVERTSRTRKAKLLDVLRMEVALVEGKEFYKWPGEGQFAETDLRNLVQGGAIGNGSFALHAKALFNSSVPRFMYMGEVVRNDRRTHKWDYVVPQNLSGYNVRSSTGEAVVGYHGSIWVDVASLDLVRLEVHADDIPPRLGIEVAFTAVEYIRVAIGGESFLLPSLSELEMRGLDQTTNSNLTKFSGCRQYSGESTLIFEESVDEPKAAQPVRLVQAPPKLRFELALQHEVVLRNSAVGDPVTAVLKRDMKLPDGTVVPKESLIHGRLASLREQNFNRYPGTAIGLKFFEIEAPGTRVRMSATLEEIQTAQPGFRARSAFGGNGSLTRPENEALFGSIFFVDSRVLRLERGLRMVWRTTDKVPEDNQ